MLSVSLSHGLINTSTVMPSNQWSEAGEKTQWTPRKAQTCPYRSCHFSPFPFLHLCDVLPAIHPSWKLAAPLVYEECTLPYGVWYLPSAYIRDYECFEGKDCLIFCLMQCLGQWWNFWIQAGNCEEWILAGKSWVDNIASFISSQWALDGQKTSNWSLIIGSSNLTPCFFVTLKA